jgi:hypothetical protein
MTHKALVHLKLTTVKDSDKISSTEISIYFHQEFLQEYLPEFLLGCHLDLLLREGYLPNHRSHHRSRDHPNIIHLKELDLNHVRPDLDHLQIYHLVLISRQDLVELDHLLESDHRPDHHEIDRLCLHQDIRKMTLTGRSVGKMG